jgi:hypothetical protein
VRRLFNSGPVAFNVWFGRMKALLLMDERESAISDLTQLAKEPRRRAELRRIFQIDPRLAPWRDDAEIKAILAEPPAHEL